MKITFICLVITIAIIVINFLQLTKAVIDYNNKANEAKIGDIPYIAMIKVLHPHTGVFMPICAGSIISKYDILTNAVCASACQHPPHCKLYVGRVNIDGGGVEIQIESTVWHETYVQINAIKPFAHTILDFGIIHTKGIPLSNNVTIIEMSDEVLKQPGSYDGMISGWGADTDQEFEEVPKYHSILKYGNVSYRDCKAPTETFRSICVTLFSKPSDVQPGISDMGTPLIDKDTDKDLLSGVGSYYHLRYEVIPNNRTFRESLRNAKDPDHMMWWKYNKYFPVGRNIKWIKDNMSRH